MMMVILTIISWEGVPLSSSDWFASSIKFCSSCDFNNFDYHLLPWTQSFADIAIRLYFLVGIYLQSFFSTQRKRQKPAWRPYFPPDWFWWWRKLEPRPEWIFCLNRHFPPDCFCWWRKLEPRQGWIFCLDWHFAVRPLLWQLVSHRRASLLLSLFCSLC